MDKGDDYTVIELLDNSERAVNKMREEYDFTNARKNPYTERSKKQMTSNIDPLRIVGNHSYSQERLSRCSFIYI